MKNTNRLDMIWYKHEHEKDRRVDYQCRDQTDKSGIEANKKRVPFPVIPFHL
jgi:hypothetical protein